MEGYFDKKSKTYNIASQENWKRGNQVFICYGNHSNITLLIEYGFVLSNNSHNCIRLRNIDSLFPDLLPSISNIKEQWLVENNLLPNSSSTKQ
jgi:hypothetical protein